MARGCLNGRNAIGSICSTNEVFPDRFQQIEVRDQLRFVEGHAERIEEALAAQLRETLVIMRRDNRRAWSLGQDGEWTRVETTIEGEPTVDTFEALMAVAAESAAS